jgi:hypothetical protein
MERDQSLLEAARAVRSELPLLVGSDWRSLDRELAGVITATNRSDDDLVTVLDRNPAVGAWVADFLVRVRSGTSAFETERGSGASPPPGDAGLLLPPRYACPIDGEFVQYRMSGAQPIAVCPDHDVTLVLTPK